MRSPDEILEPLNADQRQAATAVSGPVAILAGAGTGKTTTITHRIAYQVASGTFPADQILAVTFTEKAAAEMKDRLRRLDADGVEARTFHAAALSQLGRLWPIHVGRALPEIVGSKAPIVASLANALPPPHRFMARGELAGEIEWAKNRLIPPGRYLESLEPADHQPPIPAEHMHRVYDGYERRKTRAGRIDFEDMLRLAVELFEERPEAAAEVRSRFRSFTVDEYQDVNQLQQRLLEQWLGDRRDVCVVGDDYQTIYAFTGASPEHLLGFPERYPDATVVRLERNYRSTPQVLAVANSLASRMGGFRKKLTTTRADGPNPTARALRDDATEIRFVLDEIRRLAGNGISLEHIAVLYRINARSEPYEEAFAAAAIPYQVRDGSFLRRLGPRSVLAAIRRHPEAGAETVASLVRRVTDDLGFDPDGVPGVDEELTRQADLGRLRSLATEFDSAHPDAGPGAFVEELSHRFHAERSARGVNLLTYHRAKGLEFDAVFLPRLLDRELPYRSQRSAADPDEERRLLFVGITRARRFLYLSRPLDAKAGPSPFLEEIGVSTTPSGPSAGGRTAPRPARIAAPSGGGPLFDRLKTWRRDRAKADGVPAYVIFHDATLAQIAERRPASRDQLAGVSGVGPTKLDRYADEVLAVVRSD